MINLILALTWLVVALAIFAGNQINPRLDVRLAWFALFLVVFNVIRWWLLRPRSKQVSLVRHHSTLREKVEPPPSPDALGPLEDVPKPPSEKP